jgi:hypothetical protein
MKKGETKVTFKVPAKMADSFRHQLDTLSLKRDAFLAFMIARELPSLARERQPSGLPIASSARLRAA